MYSYRWNLPGLQAAKWDITNIDTISARASMRLVIIHTYLPLTSPVLSTRHFLHLHLHPRGRCRLCALFADFIPNIDQTDPLH
jgi:hypothetical protein